MFVKVCRDGLLGCLGLRDLGNLARSGCTCVGVDANVTNIVYNVQLCINNVYFFGCSFGQV